MTKLNSTDSCGFQPVLGSHDLVVTQLEHSRVVSLDMQWILVVHNPYNNSSARRGKDIKEWTCLKCCEVVIRLKLDNVSFQP